MFLNGVESRVVGCKPVVSLLSLAAFAPCQEIPLGMDGTATSTFASPPQSSVPCLSLQFVSLIPIY